MMTCTLRANVHGRLAMGFLWIAIAGLLMPPLAVAQSLTGTLIGTVKDEQGGVLAGALVTVSSPALIGGPQTQKTDNGQVRFPALPPGVYVLDVVYEGLRPYHEEGITIGAGAIIELPVELTLSKVEAAVVVDGSGSRIDSGGAGVVTRFRTGDIDAIPMRRFSPYDWVKVAPGISPTSPAGANVLVSAFGSGVDQNQFLIDGTSITATGNGVARADPGIGFIQELRIQSVGASIEYGNVQGAVVDVITKSGSNRFLYDAAYFWQPPALTSQPTRIEYDRARQLDSGYERSVYRDFTTSLGGPVARDRLWFFSGYQSVRDADSQPGTDPALPRRYEQDKMFAKLTWHLAEGWRLVQTFHDEFWSNPETPTSNKPRDATQTLEASVPAINFGHLTHTFSANTVWDLRVGGFRFAQDTSPTSGDPTIPNRIELSDNSWIGGPQQIGKVRQVRMTAKVTLSHYRAAWLGAAHEWRIGAQMDRGEHRAVSILPTGESYAYTKGVLSRTTFQLPNNSGGRFVTAAAFVSDALRVGSRVTINPGVRFDHSRAISQDVPEFDALVQETGRIIEGRGTLGTWNIVSPRIDGAIKLDRAGRTLLRANAGRFSQGMLTGELSAVHPGRTRNTIRQASGTTLVRDPSQTQLDPELRPPSTDQYSVAVDREVSGQFVVSAAYVRKNGRDFIGWEEVAGEYDEQTALADGRDFQLWKLTSPSENRVFLLTNPKDYSLTYDGLVIAVERRRSRSWQAFGSYTLSKAYGLQPSSGTTAAGAQVATVGSPPASFAPQVTFGQDPNDLINARGRLPNDRPHMFRIMTAGEVPHTGLMVAANLQHLSGKPWARTALINPTETARPVLIEPRGTERLSSQTLLDVRVSKAFLVGGLGRLDVCLDVLNVLDDTAEEAIRTDVYSLPGVGEGTIFIDPRRAMLSLRLNLGR